jgi:prepilin-type N-terminal cleavage/methylation domain-containing protein
MLQNAARRRGGFTLLELVIVMTIIGIVLTITMPHIDVARLRMNAGFRQVGMTLLVAQRNAVMRQHAVVVAFDSAGRRLRIHDDRNNDGVVQAGELIDFVQLEDGVVFGRGTAPPLPIGGSAISFVKRQGALPALTFQRSGSAGERGVVYLTSARGVASTRYASDGRAFVVTPATGRTTQFEYAGGQWIRRF